jgi:hypothetical protein
MNKSTTGYVTIIRPDLYGIKAVPIGTPKDGKREFITMEKHPNCPTGKLWLERKDIGQAETHNQSLWEV